MKLPDLSALSLSTPMRLRDLIRQIRAAKTANEERDIVRKESAFIRDSFRDEDNTWRCRNVAKLLYISLLGYPAHFGQLECLKLIASQRFTDKRIGYLGAMLLLDEQQDIHVLVTHSLKTDLNSSNQYVAGLALCALGVICSPAMSRDLGNEIEKLMKSTNPYLKKKAILCAVRIIKKAPEQADLFQNPLRNLLSEKDHGVLLAKTALIKVLCEESPEMLQSCRKFVPDLVRILRTLIVTGCSPDHDVSGISDPFLQIHLLRLLRSLARNDIASSDYLNDILTQVASSTDGSKTVGNAVLYEAVMTIMNIKSESALRVVGVNILGRFLLNNDKNIRYVALNTLLRVVHADYASVQRHRETIIECLKDPDISIKRRAMELCFALINKQNIELLTEELLQFLARCETEFKAVCTSNMFSVMERFAPSKQWHVDKMIKVLKTAGNIVRDDIVSSLISKISSTQNLQAYAAEQLYEIIRDDITQQPLVQVAAWTLGEFGDLLIAQQQHKPSKKRICEIEVVDVIERILNWSISTIVTRQYAINALMKLSTRFLACSDRIQSVITYYTCDMNLELQTRALEYTTIFTKHNELRFGLIERMPILINPSSGLDTQPETVNEHENTENEETSDDTAPDQDVDLLGIISETSDAATSKQNSNDSNFVNDIFQTNSLSSNAIPPMRVLERNGLHIVFYFERQNEMLLIYLEAKNSNPMPLTNFIFRAAVPKTLSLELVPPNTTIVAANNNDSLRQTVKISNPNRSELRMRIKITYEVENRPITEELEINKFPEQCYK